MKGAQKLQPSKPRAGVSLALVLTTGTSFALLPSTEHMLDYANSRVAALETKFLVFPECGFSGKSLMFGVEGFWVLRVCSLLAPHRATLSLAIPIQEEPLLWLSCTWSH